MKTTTISEFVKYVDKEILPATLELESLQDQHRKHLQKLVYTNLVNRFDAMIDNAILDNCKEEVLFEKAIKSMSGEITEGDLLKLLLKADTIQDVIEGRLRSSLSMGVLRERHSKKLSFLLEALSHDNKVWTHPRVNTSTGRIVDSFKIQNKKIPHSICGYADWLYSRRNAFVHGIGASSILENDANQINKLFKITVGKQIRLQIGSIKNAATFYKQLAGMLM
ncbi:hypothetical protein OW493_04440 [Cobetia sp. 14N.309.X.WAT.E.A4]|uniref:hypothetical protein n=1 Tax=unclassified Cobetia TaxID=2609414 RepID=UPI00244A58D9|nr:MULTISPECIES: hypothetical protein [unclassified Cobetia]MDH2292102.1 hypothetical protein [Cobetia sp. 10Alg 146]MDN2655687.1 hypothetical protein [Cobetia sp. 14N.309.X.WAT.E.A4]